MARYVDSDHLPINDNPIENIIHPIIIGKKNWLFAGSAPPRKQAAAIQILLATAKASNVKPLALIKVTLKNSRFPLTTEFTNCFLCVLLISLKNKC
ncbi:IS66 family transposase [Undibacterium sp. SXout7W]|uniref:IS66 family transposase n=1 Tax=Undibacterium sp. SXout7W TaxID=3413049 RepID=UPI003BF29C1B